MESNRCNFDQSKALKALGYKGKTKHFFKNGLAEESYYEWDKNDHREWLCTRPTVSDAIRWFRVEKGCHTSIHVSQIKGVADVHFCPLIQIVTGIWQTPIKEEFILENFNSHDDAENALLNRLIEISGKGNEQGFVSVWEFEKLMMNNLLKMNRITNVQDIGSSPNSTKPNVVGSLVNPHDRFKNAALFLCGYLKYSEDKVDDVASQIRRYAALNEPYELCTCQKCNQVVELQFYEGDDEECSHPHYTCPSSQCKAIYYDKSGKERWEELEHHYKEIEERYREQLEDSYDDDW